MSNAVKKFRKIMKYVLFSFVLLLVSGIILNVRVSYRYEREISSYWSLAEKASSISQKSEYVDKYVDALAATDLSGNNALIFKTPDNSLLANFKAILSLRDRLREISSMDEKSFAYQTAIQQITAQEQGENNNVTSTLYGGYLLHNGYWYLWDWIGVTFFCILCTIIVFCVLILIVTLDGF